MPKSKPPRRRKIRRGNDLRVLMIEGVRSALALNDAILAKIDDQLGKTPKGPARTALLAWRGGEIASPRLVGEPRRRHEAVTDERAMAPGAGR
ncbi:hypothetical protein J2800_001372 [Caulobacter rhizosphaerae]|jgi:hypothetical protein|uniref:Uncharacterized protein n=1 Tax=Caulobacter rhizosphaerae TaxID=2010972 RepID=A0ABU1MXI7_9CAUL|nr:hypothetical protein [Caulobacter rhizosphaerae]MDR6530636.1 hypothetical protein [Caulobacter rhizosphaerae]